MAKTTTKTVERVEEDRVDDDVMDTNEERLAKLSQILNYILGVVNVLLLLRLIFRAFGANAGSPIVQLIYNLTAPLLAPFRGIFGVAAAGETVIEPSIFVAMLIYTLLVKGIIELMYILAEED